MKIEREMWQYVPRINRVIKIPPSMMLQSWMGSDFTNDDLVKESSVVEDYEHTLLGYETMDEGEAYKLELIPKPEAPVAWDRMLYWVRVEDYVPLRAEFFNERGERVRTMIYSDIREMGGRVMRVDAGPALDRTGGSARHASLVTPLPIAGGIGTGASEVALGFR